MTAETINITPNTIQFKEEDLKKVAKFIVEKCINTLEFHGFDDAVPYVKWMAANKFGVSVDNDKVYQDWRKNVGTDYDTTLKLVEEDYNPNKPRNIKDELAKMNKKLKG